MNPIIVKSKDFLSALIFCVQFAFGYLVYLASNRTPAYSHLAMIKLFCLTGGWSNDLASWLIGKSGRPYDLPMQRGAFGALTEQRRFEITESLRRKGYYVFDDPLAADLCDKLLRFAVSHACTIRPMDGDQPGKAVSTTYHRGTPKAVRYDFATQDLLDNVDIQGLLADPSFVAVAQDYLGGRPVMDVLSMWWHTDFSNQPDKEAAQFFHFDMDRPKWLKFFIYLTDVETTNGPHTFVSGSHRTGGIPESLLRKGYSRITDDEVLSFYQPEDIVEFSAPRGTIIAEDTRGLHKGKHVQTADRLVLQIQFSNSMFGARYEKATLGDAIIDQLRMQIQEYPAIYSAYR